MCQGIGCCLLSWSVTALPLILGLGPWSLDFGSCDVSSFAQTALGDPQMPVPVHFFSLNTLISMSFHLPDADNIYRILQSLASSQSSSFQISPISRFFSFQLNWHKAVQGDIITIIANCTAKVLHTATFFWHHLIVTEHCTATAVHCNIVFTFFWHHDTLLQAPRQKMNM